MNTYESEHLDRIRPYLGECCVLLKSDGSFPLSEPCTIACHGTGVRNTVKGGTGSGEVNSRYFINIENGLKGAGFTIVNPQWSDDYLPFLKEAKDNFIKEIKNKAKEEKTNIIVASMGKTMKEPEYQIPLDYRGEAALYVVSRISGEGNDRTDEKGDFRLNDSEIRDILALNEHYEKFILLINAGGPVDLTPVMEVRNILVISQLGVETGHAVADILLGKQNPSGRLATTWSSYDSYCHEGDFAEKDDTRYREGIYVGYRWFDAYGIKPLFPFGYGLSYTSFVTEIREVRQDKGIFTVKAEITNTGSYEGKETIQVYLSAPEGKLNREIKSLAAFAKTKSLKPGEKTETELCFDIRDQAGYDSEKACYILEKGQYVLLLGSDSENVGPIGVYELPETVVLRKVRNLSGKIDFTDIILENRRDFDLTDIAVEQLDPEDFRTEVISYEREYEFDDRLLNLTDEDLAYLNVGAFNPKGGLLSVIGDASQSVAGAAGESTLLLKGKGINSLIMADGPAGLRLARQYYVDKKGIHAIGSTIPESMTDLLPKPIRWFLTRKPRIRKSWQLFDQFTTALPIATAIAQSWNTEFAELCGDIVGKEMEIFNVDLWLAPALNIHRNVLCGRNFEYYSEDPIISGRFAAAVTRGVQKHRGKGVTLKHYCANNQETNRYANNSVVSERALREIYLKGFGICIKEADPAALMSSYNLVNGVHTSEAHDLITDVLRSEFGFDGIIMTDWVVATDILTNNAKYPAPDAALVAASGHSLFMPGGKKDYQQILEGLKSGKVTRKQLMINAWWLLRALEKAGK